METLAKHMQDWRKRHGISQAKAAQYLGMALPTLRHIEQGRDFKFHHILILATEGFDARAEKTRKLFAEIDANTPEETA
jgi:transcriptional regulator with XRE-family HTH domain